MPIYRLLTLFTLCLFLCCGLVVGHWGQFSLQADGLTLAIWANLSGLLLTLLLLLLSLLLVGLYAPLQLARSLTEQH